MWWFNPKVDFHEKSKKYAEKGCKEIYLAQLLAQAEATTQMRSEMKLWKISILANLIAEVVTIQLFSEK